MLLTAQFKPKWASLKIPNIMLITKYTLKAKACQKINFFF